MEDGNPVDLAADLATYGVAMQLTGQHAIAVVAIQQALAVRLHEWSGLLVSVELSPPDEIPALAHPEHFHLKLTRHSLRILGRDDGTHRALAYLRRFSAIGWLCGLVAPMLDDVRPAELVIDISDGSDCGDYRRFAFCSSRPDACLIPDPYFIETIGYQELRKTVAAEARPWCERAEVVFWRGGATGIGVRGWPAPGEALDLHCLQRLSLCAAALALSRSDRADIGLTCLKQIPRADIREQIEAAGLTRQAVGGNAFMAYRYLIDIDGNSNSWGLLEKMIMGATILKVASMKGYRQWYYRHLKPWVHFVPIAADLADFEQKLDWVFAHPQECEAIAANAMALADQLRFESVMLDAKMCFLEGIAESLARSCCAAH